MANATSQALMTTTPWGDDKVKRDLAATAAVYYPGTMISLDASGNAVKAGDTAGTRFDGIQADSFRITVETGDAAGDKKITVQRPFRFSMKIAAATAADLGKPVYAVFDNEVAFTSTNSIRVGWVDRIVSATEVEIRPEWTGVGGVVGFTGETLTFTGATSANTVVIPDNLADGLSFKEGSNAYLTFITTNSGERVQLKKQTLLGDSIKLAFGDADDITMAWDGTDFDVLQATADSSIKWGIDGAGIDHVFYGDTASAAMTWDQSADSLILSGVAKIKAQTIVAAHAAAIPVTHSGSFPITQNGAETNTLAIPTFLGQWLTIFVDTDTSGARVITSAQRINQAANTIITLTEVGDFIKLEAVTIGGALRWQVVANEGAVLS